MLRKAPPLEAIEIFVAAAEGDSFRSVARRLALSPSAVSRRIATLEAFVGTPLFDRSGQSQQLSAAGERYFAAVEPALRAIQRASAGTVDDVRPHLTVAASHSLAAGWLMRRIPEAQHALQAEIDVVPTRDTDALRSGEVQMAIWGGLQDQREFTSELLIQGVAAPVATRSRARSRLWCDRSLADVPLLAVQDPSGLWERWFAGTGVTAPREIRTYPTAQLMYEAAAAGTGIALAMPLLVDPYLESGRLALLGMGSRPIGESYRFFAMKRRNGLRPVERAFADWFRLAAREVIADFERISRQ